MKKFYSIVLMAVALLVGTNVKAEVATISINGGAAQTLLDGDALTDAILGLADGDAAVIDMKTDATVGATVSGGRFFDGGKSITWNLNGKTIDCSLRFNLGHATLNVQGPGTIDMKIANIFAATYGSKDKAEAYGYCTLTIGAGVVVNSASQYALGLFPRDYYDPTYTGKATKDNGELVQTDWKSKYGAGAGVTINIYGEVYSLYGVSSNGQLAATVGNVPVVNIYEGAIINTRDNNGIYAAGYAIWNIQGKVTGTTGIYAKGGVFNLDGATITGTAPYEKPTTNNNGTSGGGSGIVFDGNGAYAGEMELHVTGDTKVISSNGYAFEELVTSANTSATKDMEIESGTFKGDVKMGSLDLTPELGENVKINGSITGGTYNSDITEYLSNITGVITPTKDENGNTIYVVAEKPAETPAWISNINNATAASYVRLDGNGEQTLAGSKATKYLVMQGNNDKVIVPAGKTLTVEEVVMGPDAVIEVKAGGNLIVKGDKGIVANQKENIVIETAEGTPAIFLMDPDVTSNKNPKAIVQFVSKSYFKSATDYANQRFGIPTIGTLESITAEYKGARVATAFDRYENNKWNLIGYIHTDKTPALDYSKMANPFEYFQMQNNNPVMGTVVTMTGNLVGNTNPKLNVRGNDWNGFANSFTGKMSIEELIDMIPESVDKAFYLYDITQNQATWEPFSLLNAHGVFIDPMQPFLIRNTKDAAEVTVDYKDAVYTPAVNPSAAPARRVASDMTSVKMIVRGEECIDRVTVAESNMFSAGFDNGYDAAKYMNDGINMYVTANEKMSIYATDNLNNTYMGIAGVKGGTYSINFEKVAGESLTLIDLETGAKVDMTEGGVYEFEVAANTVNDYRFQIVGRAAVATDVENISAANNGAVYTIMGQYVGQIGNWNNLPAGIYVVDGVKRVK